ncbi:MAG: aliphatic sulfonate ABC transporter substrate-binding protein [Oscillospiraceae bacterium]|nr:aliphatic sulfonate ABC transporter substrate-binding protein [Oscillospiraceae bacterium]
MFTKKSRVISIVIVAIMAVSTCFISGCGADDKKAINVGYFNNVTHAQALLMKADGILQDKAGKDVELTWTSFNAGPAEIDALKSGSIDIGYIGPVPAITANVTTRGDVVILSSATKGGAILVQRKGAGIKDVKDLAGKIVAIPQIGNTQHLNLLKLLSDNGLEVGTGADKVDIRAVENGMVSATMADKKIDAALVPEPWGATLLADGAELVMDYKDIYMDGDYDVAVVVVRKEFMEENPELVDKFLEAHNLATDTINNDKEKSIKTINEEINSATGKKLTDDILTEAFTRIGVSTNINKSALADFAQISKDENLIKEIPDESTLYANK